MTVDEVEEVEVEVGVLEVVEDVVEEVVVVEDVRVEVGVEATGVGKRLDVAAEVSKAYWHQSAKGVNERERGGTRKGSDSSRCESDALRTCSITAAGVGDASPCEDGLDGTYMWWFDVCLIE